MYSLTLGDPQMVDILEIDEPDDWKDVSDKIEQALWEIKKEWNFPEDEIKKAVFSRRIYKKEQNEVCNRSPLRKDGDKLYRS